MKDTIMDYVKWRGDLTIFDFPYTQIDYLILSELAYCDFDNINFTTPLTLKETCERYMNKENIIHNECHDLFSAVSQSKRFQDIQIIHYENEVNKELVKQFAAVTFLLENYTLVVSYRGTDDSLIGWHEDFLMLYHNTVPSQLSAVKYLETSSQYRYTASLWDSLTNKHLGSIYQRIKKHFQYKKGLPIIVTGHSKGGNLAIYSGCFVDSDIQDRIIKIYNYDGPGFQDEIMKSQQYQSMLNKIISYIPHYSFFGIVLGHEEEYQVVHSQNIGMYQHNPFSWSLSPYDFEKDELSYESVQFAIKVILFLDKLDYDSKKNFIDALFNLFDSLNLYQFSDLGHLSVKTLLDALKEIHSLDNDVKKILVEAINIMWLESKKAKKL